MSKDLEALERIKENCDLLDDGYQWDKTFSKIFDEDINTIEKTINDHEKLKQEHEFLREHYNELFKDYRNLNEQLKKANYFLKIDVFTFIEIMNPFHNIYVWNNHNKQIVKLCCFGARRTYNGKEIYVSNTSCTAWLELKEYGNTWSLNKVVLEKKWLNDEKEVKNDD